PTCARLPPFEGRLPRCPWKAEPPVAAPSVGAPTSSPFDPSAASDAPRRPVGPSPASAAGLPRFCPSTKILPIPGAPMTIWPLPAKVTDEPKPSPGDGLALAMTRHLPVRVLKRNTRPGLLASDGAPKTISSPAAAIEDPN